MSLLLFIHVLVNWYAREQRIGRTARLTENRPGCASPGPGDRHPGINGNCQQSAQGEEVIGDIRNTVPLQEVEQIDKAPTAGC
jgi:hypothetical protein